MGKRKSDRAAAIKSAAALSLAIFAFGSPGALAADDDSAICAASSGRERVIPACTRLIESGQLGDEQLAIAYSHRGRARLWNARTTDFDPAMADHNEAVRLAPKQATVYVNRGLAWWRLGKRDKAGEDIDAAIALDPGSAEAYYARAQVFRFTVSLRDRVIADYDKTISLKPDHLEAYYAQASLFARHDEDRAIGNYTKIIELNPAWDGGIAYQARANSYLAKGEYRLALADHAELLRLSPSVDNYNYRGSDYLHLHEYEKAEADFRKSLELNAHNPVALAGLADIFMAKPDASAALAEINKAIGIAPGIPGLYLERAEFLLNLGRTAEALADTDMILKPFPRSPDAHLMKGRIYEAMGRKDEAVDEFRTAQSQLSDPKTAEERKVLDDSTAGLSRLGATP